MGRRNRGDDEDRRGRRGAAGGDSGGQRGRRAPPSLKVWEHDLGGGWRVLAGRTAQDNDRLSLKVARANDWWFHVRGMPSSHVILQGPDGEEPSREILRRAAAVAAYYSKARGGGVTPVSATRAQYVTKPRGAKPGTVQIRKEVVLKVRPGLPDPAQPEPS